MAEHITDTETFTITILAHGNIEITDLIHPTTVFSGTPFTVSYASTNSGGADACYGKLINTTGNLIIDQWQQTLASGATKSTTINFPNGITSSLSAKIEVGYITPG